MSKKSLTAHERFESVFRSSVERMIADFTLEEYLATEARVLADALLSPEFDELPSTDRAVLNDVKRRFANGIAHNAGLASRYLAGQRRYNGLMHDWFIELYFTARFNALCRSQTHGVLSSIEIMNLRMRLPRDNRLHIGTNTSLTFEEFDALHLCDTYAA